MKTPLFISLALATLVSAHAEVFRPGMARGGRGATSVAISYSNGPAYVGYRSGWRGGSGVYLGARAYPYYSRPYSGYGAAWRPYYSSYPVYVQPAPVVYADYGYDSGYTYGTPSRAASGLWLGALVGAIIGNNSGSLGHDAWRGAAYGAGAGLIIGAVADHNARQREVVAERAAAVRREMNQMQQQPQVASAAPQGTTIINNYYNTPAATPMSSANSLFGRN